MARRRPHPRPAPPPLPRPDDQPPISETEQVLDELANLVGPAGGVAAEYTETVIFEFSAATVQSFRVRKDGFIRFIKSSSAATYVTINVDPPSAGSVNGGATKVWDNLVYGDGVGNSNASAFEVRARIRGPNLSDINNFTLGDIVWVRGPLGCVCQIVMSYPLSSL